MTTVLPTPNSITSDIQKKMDYGIAEFSKRTAIPNIKFDIKESTDKRYIIFYLSEENNRFYKILNQLEDELGYDPSDYHFGMSIKKRREKPKEPLNLPEVQLLQKTLSESLTMTRDSFLEDFFERYVPTVSGAEDQIRADSNHIV